MQAGLCSGILEGFENGKPGVMSYFLFRGKATATVGLREYPMIIRLFSREGSPSLMPVQPQAAQPPTVKSEEERVTCAASTIASMDWHATQ